MIRNVLKPDKKEVFQYLCPAFLPVWIVGLRYCSSGRKDPCLEVFIMYYFLMDIFLNMCKKLFAEKSKANCLQKTMWNFGKHSDEVCASHLEHFSDRSYQVWSDSDSSFTWVQWLTSCWAVTTWSYRYLPETSAEACWPQVLSRTVKCAMTVNKKTVLWDWSPFSGWVSAIWAILLTSAATSL